MKHSTSQTDPRQYLYTGPPPGQHSVHHIIQHDRQINEIITWSLPYPPPHDHGFTWRGPKQMFDKLFKVTE